MTNRPMPICNGVCANPVAMEARPIPMKKDAHHAVLAPLIGNPARRHGEKAEGEETGGRVGQQFRVADIPLAIEHQGSDGRETKGEQMVEKMPNVQQQKIRLIPVHCFRLLHVRPVRNSGHFYHLDRIRLARNVTSCQILSNFCQTRRWRTIIAPPIATRKSLFSMCSRQWNALAKHSRVRRHLSIPGGDLSSSFLTR